MMKGIVLVGLGGVASAQSGVWDMTRLLDPLSWGSNWGLPMCDSSSYEGSASLTDYLNRSPMTFLVPDEGASDAPALELDALSLEAERATDDESAGAAIALVNTMQRSSQLLSLFPEVAEASPAPRHDVCRVGWGKGIHPVSVANHLFKPLLHGLHLNKLISKPLVLLKAHLIKKKAVKFFAAISLLSHLLHSLPHKHVFRHLGGLFKLSVLHKLRALCKCEDPKAKMGRLFHKAVLKAALAFKFLTLAMHKLKAALHMAAAMVLLKTLKLPHAVLRALHKLFEKAIHTLIASVHFTKCLFFSKGHFLHALHAKKMALLGKGKNGKTGIFDHITTGIHGKFDGFHEGDGKFDFIHGGDGKFDGIHGGDGKFDGKFDGIHNGDGKFDLIHGGKGKFDGIHNGDGKFDGIHDGNNKFDGIHDGNNKFDDLHDDNNKFDDLHEVLLGKGKFDGIHGEMEGERRLDELPFDLDAELPASGDFAGVLNKFYGGKSLGDLHRFKAHAARHVHQCARAAHEERLHLHGHKFWAHLKRLHSGCANGCPLVEKKGGDKVYKPKLIFLALLRKLVPHAFHLEASHEGALAEYQELAGSDEALSLSDTLANNPLVVGELNDVWEADLEGAMNNLASYARSEGALKGAPLDLFPATREAPAVTPASLSSLLDSATSNVNITPDLARSASTFAQAYPDVTQNVIAARMAQLPDATGVQPQDVARFLIDLPSHVSRTADLINTNAQ